MNKPATMSGDKAEAEATAAVLSEQGIDLQDLAAEEDILADVRVHEDQQAILDGFARRRLARTLAVPTDDLRVRMKLRELGEPMTLFGEGPGERRDRLKEIMSTMMMQGDKPSAAAAEASDSESDESSEDEEIKEEFFTLGSEELAAARRAIRDFSLPRAKARHDMERAELEIPLTQRKKLRHDWYTNLMAFETKSLQVGDDRPMGYCAFAPNSRMLATASWSGLIKLWSVPDLDEIGVLRGHRERVSGLAFHPQSTLSQPTGAINAVSGAVDGSVNLWSFEKDTPIGKLEGHTMRVARVAFHPSGRFIGTASSDATWRLWDAETQKQLIMQMGHSREVFSIGFQHDGALAATAGMDAIGRVWDLRTGRSVMVLQGHVKPVISLDWSSNGYQMATGSEDHTIRVWDVRAAAAAYTIPAHKNIVSQVRYWNCTDAFESASPDAPWELPLSEAYFASMNRPRPVPRNAAAVTATPAAHQQQSLSADQTDGMDVDGGDEGAGAAASGPPTAPIDRAMRRQILSGSFLVSSSYDSTCKMWTDGDYKPLKALTGLEAKVMCTDISGDGKYIAAALYDRRFKLYANSD
ncbi:hypothetical protein HK105_209150 [Polyrhizophydium stewartii]|uniref:Pre-mRNA processing factor 4 (PRP4)-like domain-containing protein n=1 Tax=Polyrhizophydium stewartii TaxID=2732419 RepID=A0ABR4MVX2_9FUNG